MSGEFAASAWRVAALSVGEQASKGVRFAGGDAREIRKRPRGNLSKTRPGTTKQFLRIGCWEKGKLRESQANWQLEGKESQEPGQASKAPWGGLEAETLARSGRGLGATSQKHDAAMRTGR